MISMTAWKLSCCGVFLSAVLLAPLQPALAQADQTPTPAPASAPANPAPETPAADSAKPATPSPATQDSATHDPATPAAPAAPRHHASPRNQRPTLDDRIAALSKNLELTEPQRTAVKNILIRRQQQTLRIRNSAVPGDVRIGQFRALQDQTINEIRAVLTDDQKKKYDPLVLRNIPKSDEPQRSLEDWIKLTTPHNIDK
jgi:hypothetical protein